MKDAPLTMFPMLEIKAGQLLCDTQSIALFIIQSSGKTSLLGKNLQEQGEVEQWMQYLKQEIVPLSKSLQYFSFGQMPCESVEEFNGMQSLYKENIKVINNQLKNKLFLVGDQLTIADVYLCLSLVEMQQGVMDPNLKNSLNFLNKSFAATAQLPAFTKRMGIIKVGKKQFLPSYKA